MAGYPTVNPRAFGCTYAAPTAISRLPVNLLRTSLVTRDPAATHAAAAEYREAVEAPGFKSAPMLPQRMMFQQHKVGPGGVHRGDPRDALSSAAPLMLAAHSTGAAIPGLSGLAGLSAVSTVQIRVPERVPTYSEAAAANARGAQAFPIPEMPIPMSGVPTRVRPNRQRIAPPMEAFGVEQREMHKQQAAQQAQRAGNALQAVELAKQHARARLGIR